MQILKKNYPVLYFSELVLEIMSYLTPNVVYRDLRVSKIFLEKLFKFVSSYKINKWVSYFILYLLLETIIKIVKGYLIS